MGNRKLALFMSFIWPGLGQIYKRELLKGISFIAICALMVVSLFFLSPQPQLLYYSGFSVLLLMWLLGMLDAFVDDELLIGSKRWLNWRTVLSILLIIVVFSAVVMLMLLWMQDFSETEGHGADSETATKNLEKRTEADAEDAAETVDSEFFAIQVASFGESERAEEIYRDLLDKGYTVSIEQMNTADKIWHRVLVGKFISEQDAINFRYKLYNREGFSSMVIRRRYAEAE